MIKLLAGILVYLGLQQLVELSTRGFCLERIREEHWQEPLSASVPAHIQEVVKQPFFMIGSGSECFAFASQDGETVIKFFKLDHVRPVYLHRGLLHEDYSAYSAIDSSWKWRHRLSGIREFRLKRNWKSIQLAFADLKDETALLYLHLHPSTEFTQPLTLHDRCGIAHTLDLNTTPFILQKRATPLLTHFERLLSLGNIPDAQQSIDSLLTLLMTRCQKGIADRDIVSRNFGYIGTQAVEIDTGSFSPLPLMKEKWLYSQELCYATLELKGWLKQRAPELAHYLESQVNQVLE